MEWPVIGIESGTEDDGDGKPQQSVSLETLVTTIFHYHWCSIYFFHDHSPGTPLHCSSSSNPIAISYTFQLNLGDHFSLTGARTIIIFNVGGSHTRRSCAFTAEHFLPRWHVITTISTKCVQKFVVSFNQQKDSPNWINIAEHKKCGAAGAKLGLSK